MNAVARAIEHFWLLSFTGAGHVGELHWNGLLPWMPLNLPDPPAKACAPTFSLDERTST